MSKESWMSIIQGVKTIFEAERHEKLIPQKDKPECDTYLKMIAIQAWEDAKKLEKE